MYLLIDLSNHNSINLSLFNETKRFDKVFVGRNRELLECVDKTIKNHKSKIINHDVQGIMVVVGTGSFTSTRIACVVANTFAYALQIPLLAIKKDDVDKVQELIPKLLKQKPGHYLSAIYSGEPNITLPKVKSK